jgi:hypothetical protein
VSDRDAYGPTIAFASNIAHAMILAEAFQMAGVAADPTLFDVPQPKPAGGLRWGERLTSGAWGCFNPSTTSITVSPLLNSLEAPEFVLDFIVFHELLHHEDHQSGRAGAPHGGDFRSRERRFPRHVDADGWLDAFHDRFVADDSTGVAPLMSGAIQLQAVTHVVANPQ